MSTTYQGLITITDLTDNKACEIRGVNVFKYNENGEIPSASSSITLTAILSDNISGSNWQYKNSLGNFVDFSPITTGDIITINHTDDIFINDVATIKKLTSDESVFDIFTITKIRDGSPGDALINAVLSNDNQIIPCDGSGIPFESAFPVSSKITIYEGTEDITNKYSISATIQSDSGVPRLIGNISGDTFTATSWNALSQSYYTATVTFTCTRAGYPPINKVLTLSKVATGSSPNYYELTYDILATNKNISNIFNPSSVTFRANHINGELTEDYQGYLKLYRVKLDGTQETITTSNMISDGASGYKYTYTFSQTLDTNTKYLLAELYKTDGVGDYLDKQSIIVTSDGQTGASPINIVLGNVADVIPCDVDGKLKTNLTINIPFTAYKGTSQISATITKSNITTRPSNLTDDDITITSSTSSSSGNIQFKLYAGSELGNNSGEITLTFTCDGKQVPMKYGWSKSIQAKPGADGKTSYFHIKYSSVANPTSSSDMSETPLAYIGTYVDFIEADSTDPKKYTWSRFEGIQGEKGEQGIPGIGQDGSTSYLHIAYATSADGSEGFSISESANKTYIGQYTDFISTDSTDPTKYAWTKIKGEMSAEQIAQLNQASSDASEAKTDASTAKTTAQTANSTAQSAQNTASQAQTKAEQALEASSITTETLKAESARIDTLETGKANIADLNAEKARIDTLETNKADISTLNAETARIDNLIATKASIESLDAESARINNLESTKADITSLNAGIARIDTLEAGKANIDLANVNNAWITNGVIKDASIANEKVISVSANKLTAGTIDASKITVTNLNADNITVGTINGARIGNNSIDLNKLSQEVPTKEYLDSVEQKLQGEIDGAIETFTVSEIPTLNNEPAVNWTTDDIRSTHVGDLCYVVNNASDNDGFCYRFQYNGTVYSWALIKDNDVTKAIQDIAELNGEVTQFKTDYTSKVSEIDGGIESLKSRTTTIETTYSTKTYTDTKTSDALTSANSYADNKASSTLTEANSYADNKASTTLSSAKTYADSTASSTLTSANDYADGKANKALTDANKYTDTAANNTLTSANTYSDNKASDALTSANSYADTKASSALTDAKSYADSTASSTLGEAKSYTDTATADMATTGDIPTKVSELTNDSSFATTTQVSTAKSEAISTASADATSKANSALDSAKSYTDAVEIGGRNLLPDTDFGDTSKKYIVPDGVVEGSGGEGGFQFTPTTQIESGIEYTLSLRMRGVANVNFYELNTGGNIAHRIAKRSDLSETDYKKISLTFVVSTDRTFQQVFICTAWGLSATGDWFEIEPKSLKLEKGNKATDWTPAPEDVDASISDAQTAADNAQTAANNAQSTADTAKANAATAQSTADTAKSNAAAAQTAANKAQTTANDAKAKAEAAQTAVSTKVETSVFNTLKNTVDENSANITSLTETVTTKADSSTVTTLSNTVNKVKQTADANSSSISNLTTTVNSKADGSKVTALENKTSTIEQNLSGVTTRVTNLESENDGLDTRLTTAESKITADAIVNTVTSSKTYKDALSGKVDTSVYNTKMEQLDNSISLKATATDVYTKTQADSALATAKSEAISSANSYTDTATTDMATKEYVTKQGYLTVTSDAITSKVSKNEVISAINQTAESVSINANKINLTGAVTFSSFDNSLQTTINNKAETSALEGVDNKIDDITDNIYVKNSTLINGDKIGSGTITLGGTRNGDGLLEVYDSFNELVAKLSKDENIFAGFKVKAGYGILGFGDTGDLQRSYFSLQHEWVSDWQYYFEEVPSIQFAQNTFGGEKFFDSIDGWYQSNNKGYANTTAMEEIKLQISSPTHVYMDVVDCSNNTVNDYGTVSIIGGTLDETSTYSSISGDVKWTGYNNHKVGGETIDFGIVQPGVHHIMLRYKKGNSAAYENDRLYFRLYTGKEPALFYEDEAGSLMYVSKTRLYQRRMEATYDDPHNPEFISYSCYKTLIRNASMDVEMSDSDYVPINEPEIPLQRRISKTNIGGGFIDFTFNNGSTRLRYEDVNHTLYTDANIRIEEGSGITVTGLAGEIKMWAGDAIPGGWLLCDGSEVSKTDYPYLYASIGDLWGTPSSSSNFKLPNLTGRVPVGYNSADTDTTETFGKVGATGGARGAWYHTHTIGSSGAHHHASQGRMEGSGTGANIFESYNGASKTRTVNVPRTGDNGAHTHSPGSSGSSGNKLAADKANMPPYAVVKYIICAF